MLRSVSAFSSVFFFCVLVTGCGGGGSVASSSGGTTTTTSPVVALSATTIAFPATTTGQTSAAQAVTLSNTGTATLTINSMVLGGANASNFTLTTTCGNSVAASASCNVSLVFSPTAAGSYAATVTLTDNDSHSPQTISVSGTGVAATSTITRSLLVEPDQGFSSLYALITGAAKTIDMTMYELVDTIFSADLVAACQRGVKVRVILDQNLEKSSNTPAFNQLNAQPNCSAAWANSKFHATHQKTILVDGTTVAILSLNLTSRYYATTRDFGVIENDPADIAAIQNTFNTDYGAVADATDYGYQPEAGSDLIWSPTTATNALLGIINGATSTLLVENEEMSAPNIVSALEAACQRGIAVHIAMTDTGSYHSTFSALEAAGCGVHTLKESTESVTNPYIHAKAILADYGLSTQQAYMGSINFSTASMKENRELGMYLSDPAMVQALYTTLASDYAREPAY